MLSHDELIKLKKEALELDKSYAQWVKDQKAYADKIKDMNSNELLNTDAERDSLMRRREAIKSRLRQITQTLDSNSINKRTQPAMGFEDVIQIYQSFRNVEKDSKILARDFNEIKSIGDVRKIATTLRDKKISERSMAILDRLEKIKRQYEQIKSMKPDNAQAMICTRCKADGKIKL